MSARIISYAWDALNGLLWAAVIFALAGCASDPYWVKVREPIPVRGVIEVERPCGREVLGCFNLLTHNIELVPGMDAAKRWCVLNHERRTAAGDGHKRRGGFAIDCGNGEML